MKQLVGLLALLAGACNGPHAVRESTAAAGTRACIDLKQVTGRRVERGQLIYQLSSGETVRNDLGGHCPPLERAMGSEITQIENDSGQLCRGDGVRVYDPVTVGAGGPSSILRCQAAAFVTVPRG